MNKNLIYVGIGLVVLVGGYFGYKKYKESKDNNASTGEDTTTDTTGNSTAKDKIISRFEEGATFNRGDLSGMKAELDNLRTAQSVNQPLPADVPASYQESNFQRQY